MSNLNNRHLKHRLMIAEKNQKGAEYCLCGCGIKLDREIVGFSSYASVTHQKKVAAKTATVKRGIRRRQETGQN